MKSKLLLGFIFWNALVVLVLCGYQNYNSLRLRDRICAMDERLQNEIAGLSKSIAALIDEQQKIQGLMLFAKDDITRAK